MQEARGKRVLKRMLWVGLPLAIGSALAWYYRDWITARFFLRRLESDERLRRLRVDDVVRLLEIEPGSSVADVGAGSGLFTGRFAERVGPSGRVLAADANPEMVAHLRRRFPVDESPNVHIVQTPRDAATLPESVDLVFVCLTLHHIPDPEGYVQSLAAHLKPGGRIAVIEFNQDSPMHHRKIVRSELDRWMSEADLQVVLEKDDLIEDAYLRIYG